ncbi:DNA repair protein [Testudinibacter aquarius]|uniref:Putative HicB family RNase H-like nuclease n=1 Tax=Testudinibacter aquarius TaxID=1524974 RepID=A0A4R3Y0F0_9PAST|nr:DNA repair protein [Testudinibacter aquarius]TCV83644.1 putative HicB family RNase H-like nuclease [Testudinibacter aquarius]TNG91580.1 type II toxin-antitoxin system HicB family antitoxin [Testudinibacter aquarius]
MINIMTIEGHKAVIAYDDEIGLFRGEFSGLNGGADFYAEDVENLRKEGEISLREFLAVCKEKGIEPYKHYSGRFNLRLEPALHAEIAAFANAENLSLNEWVIKRLKTDIQQLDNK